MEKKRNQKGFTLAELLIVVAIIAVLVAIAIPVFSAQLEKSREATDLANIRSAYAECVTEVLTNGTDAEATVARKQTRTGWQTANHTIGTDISAAGSGGGATSYTLPDSVAVAGGNYKVKVNAQGVLTVE